MATANPQQADDGSRPAPQRPRSTARRDLVEQQIIAEATRLFAERGFSGTSLQDIADATGLTRPALYHYIKSKDDVLARLVAELAHGPAAELRRIRATEATDPAARLHEMVYRVAQGHARNPERFQLLVRSEAYLPNELVEPYRKSRRDVLKEFAGVIGEGIRSGQFRPVDPRIAALSVIGQCNWIAWWHRPGTDDEADAVARAVADLAVASVLSNTSEPAEADPARRAIAMLRRDLDFLERTLDARPGDAG